MKKCNQFQALENTESKNTPNTFAETGKEMEKVSRFKMDFLNMISHEIRSSEGNVISILGILETAVNNLQNIFYKNIIDRQSIHDSEEAKDIHDLFHRLIELVSFAKENSYYSLNSIANLCSLYKLHVGKISCNFEMTDIQGMIENIVNNNVFLKKRKITTRVVVESIISNCLLVDYKNLNDALSIVINNAIRFSPENGLVQIEVDSKAEGENNFLLLTVRDFGEGMSPLQLKTLFKTALNDDDLHDVTKYRKLSLQLPQAKIRIEAAGGEIEIQSTVKKGTTVTLLTPYHIVSGNTLPTPPLQNKEDSSFPKPKPFRILLVEDNAMTRELEKNILEELGCEVDVATNGVDAILAAEQDCYQILFVDITLPDMTGIEVMHQINSQQKSTRPFVVAVTSHVSEEDVEYFLSQGIMDVIPKPVTKQQFQNVLEIIADIESQKIAQNN
jgi:CheY-like chemotaxis protein